MEYTPTPGRSAASHMSYVIIYGGVGWGIRDFDGLLMGGGVGYGELSGSFFRIWVLEKGSFLQEEDFR